MPGTVLFLPYPSASGTWGSTVLMAAIAEQCRRDGYRTVMHACAPSAELVRSQGFETIEFEGAAAKPARRRMDSLYDVCEALGFDDLGFWQRMLDAESEAIRAVRPDVLVSHFRLTAPISAARAGLPLASLAFWSTDPRAQGDGGHRLDELARTLAREGCGLPVHTLPELVSWHADAQLASCYPDFEPELAGAPGLVYTGGIGNPYGLVVDRPAPRRLVLCYTSSAAWGTERVIGALGVAAGRVGATVWCVTRAGGGVTTESDNCVVFPYLPFDHLLPRASAAVFHGGYSTAVAALGAGVATLAVPGEHYERQANARRLHDLGAGVSGTLNDLRPSRLADILERLLDDPQLRAGAVAARQRAAGYRGARDAADIVTALLDGVRYRTPAS